jgi:hypothetical protein
MISSLLLLARDSLFELAFGEVVTRNFTPTTSRLPLWMPENQNPQNTNKT